MSTESTRILTVEPDLPLMVMWPSLLRTMVRCDFDCPDSGVLLNNCAWAKNSVWGASYCSDVDLFLAQFFRMLVGIDCFCQSKKVALRSKSSQTDLQPRAFFVWRLCVYSTALLPVDRLNFIMSFWASAKMESVAYVARR